MRRLLWLAPVLAVALAAVPVLARVCEVRCAARVTHCHEEAPKAPGSCPEKSHRTEAPSLAAAKIAPVASGDVSALVAAAAGPFVPQTSTPRALSRIPRDLIHPDTASPRVLRV